MIPIPCTKEFKHVDEKMGSLDVNLTEHESRKTIGAVKVAEALGESYLGNMMAGCLVDTPPLKSCVQKLHFLPRIGVTISALQRRHIS